MAFLFGGARQSNSGTIKDYQRKVASNARGMEREICRMELKEAQLQREMAKYAKESKMEPATSKAKEIVRLRAHKARLDTVKSQMTGLSHQLQSVQTTGKIQETITGTVQMLHVLNSRFDVGTVSKMLLEFEKQSVQMQAKQELMDDALDSGFEADGEQDDCNEAVIGVLEEVGIDVRAQLQGPGASQRNPGAAEGEADLAARLERLRTG